jgi:hypothetical protein
MTPVHGRSRWLALAVFARTLKPQYREKVRERAKSYEEKGEKAKTISPKPRSWDTNGNEHLPSNPAILLTKGLQNRLQGRVYRNGTKEAFRNSLLRKALFSGRYRARTYDPQFVELRTGE